MRRLLRDEVYLHQSRLNPKQGFGSGASWTWHQDFPPWHSIDGMPEPRCIMASVFVDDCTVAKSPLLILPGSHRRGLARRQAARGLRGKGVRAPPHRPRGVRATRRRARHRAAGRPCRLRLLRPLQHHPRLGGQRLPMAAGDSVPDLQRRQQTPAPAARGTGTTTTATSLRCRLSPTTPCSPCSACPGSFPRQSGRRVHPAGKRSRSTPSSPCSAARALPRESGRRCIPAQCRFFKLSRGT